MAKLIPTLNSDGWINEPGKVADYILSCFMTANQSSSYAARRNNTTLQYLLKIYMNDIVNLELALKEALQKKLSKVYTQPVDVSVTITPDSNKPDQYNINFLAIIRDGLTETTVGKVVQFKGANIIKIMNLNNGVITNA